MKLGDAARELAPKEGRPAKIAALRDTLKPAALVDFDEAMADATLGDKALAAAIERLYGIRVHETTVRNWRRAKGLR